MKKSQPFISRPKATISMKKMKSFIEKKMQKERKRKNKPYLGVVNTSLIVVFSNPYFFPASSNIRYLSHKFAIISLSDCG
jgi:hypothetical protein